MTGKQLIIGVASAAIAAGMWVQSSQGEIGITISVGDRPYYYGPSYWDAGYEWYWVSGYERHGHWVHGHYEKRGKFHKEHAHDHHHDHHHDKHDH